MRIRSDVKDALLRDERTRLEHDPVTSPRARHFFVSSRMNQVRQLTPDDSHAATVVSRERRDVAADESSISYSIRRESGNGRDVAEGRRGKIVS